MQRKGGQRRPCHHLRRLGMPPLPPFQLISKQLKELKDLGVTCRRDEEVHEFRRLPGKHRTPMHFKGGKIQSLSDVFPSPDEGELFNTVNKFPVFRLMRLTSPVFGTLFSIRLSTKPRDKRYFTSKKCDCFCYIQVAKMQTHHIRPQWRPHC